MKVFFQACPWVSAHCTSFAALLVQNCTYLSFTTSCPCCVLLIK